MAAAAEQVDAAPTTRTLLASGMAALTAAGVPSARLDTELLLATACGVDRTALVTRANHPVSPTAERTFHVLLERRRQREPLQYIVGRQEFWSLDMLVTPAVLIPRPETELLVELTVTVARGETRSARRPLTICDLGTGSGCIAIAVGRELPDAEIVAVDQSTAAIAVARENARRLGAECIRFVVGDLFAPGADARFDVIVANPPYVASGALAQLQPELRWEPQGALDGGADGLDVIRRIVADAPAHLASDGWLIMEIGADQKPAVLDLARAAQFRDVSVRDDYAGLPRVLLARR